MRLPTSFRRLLPAILLASGAGGCFSDAVQHAASEQGGAAEAFGEPRAVFVAADGALAVEARARYLPDYPRWPERTRYLVIEPATLQAKLQRAASSEGAWRDVEGRIIVEVHYPGGKASGRSAVIPREFDAPDAVEADLPARFRQGTRIDWAAAPGVVVVRHGTSHALKGLNYVWDGRAFALMLSPRDSDRTGPGKGGFPIAAILGPPALVLDVLTFPIQLPVLIFALERTGK